MKKTILSLLVMGLLLMLPLNVFAAPVLTPSIPKSEEQKVDNQDETMTYTYPIYVTVEGDEGEKVELDSATFSFTFGSAIQNHECGGAGNYTAAPGSETNSCVFSTTSTDPVEGKVQVGTISILVDKNASDEDCRIDYSYDGSTGSTYKDPVDTGASLPLGIIAGGLTIAFGVYFVTNRKTKLYKI